MGSGKIPSSRLTYQTYLTVQVSTAQFPVEVGHITQRKLQNCREESEFLKERLAVTLISSTFSNMAGQSGYGIGHVMD